MADRSKLIEKLLEGETVQFRPRGNSMLPRIKSGQLVTVAPASLEDLEPGDVAFCRVRGSNMVHLVKAKGDRGALISNNRGHVNGWTRTIYGKVVEVED